MPLTPAAPDRARCTALILVAALLVALATAAAAHAAPTVTVAPEDPRVGQQVTLTAKDDLGAAPALLTWSVSGPVPVVLAPQPEVAFTPAVAGTYSVTLALPGVEPVTRDVVVAPADTPPTISISPEVVEVQEGGTASFTATATDPDGPPAATLWRVLGPDPAAPFGSPGPTFSDEFDASATVEAQVTGFPGGTATATARVDVVLPTARIAIGAAEPVLQGREIVLTSASTDPGSAPGGPEVGPLEYDWDLPGEPEDDAFDDPASLPVTFTEPGVAEVVLRVRDVEQRIDEVTEEIAVEQGTAPVAAFGFSPVAVLPGLPVTFTSTATDVDGNLDQGQLAWDFGDGGGFAAGGPVVSHAYAAPGTYAVGHRVTDEAGLVDEVFDTVTVTAPPTAAPPAPPATPGAGVPQAPAGSAAPPVVGTGGAPAGRPSGSGAQRPALMAPFPVVRIAGSVFRRSARIRVLSVQLPRGARAEVRCSGRGCPVAVERRTAATRGRGSTATVRFRRFEGRSLGAGTVLTVRVTRPGAIGKYTRFRIRAGRAPSRLDRCVRPGSSRPVGCPAA